MKFFVPGKTFLVGEYAVLVGGSALGLATRPYFEFNYDDTMSVAVEDEIEFHSDSPAGRYLRGKNSKAETGSFKDQYAANGALGGFGKSTAEFFAAITPDLVKNKKSFFDILKDYRGLHSDATVKPSGIDLAFQYFGNVTLADSALNFYQTFDWHFTNLDFFIISSGLKVPTHEHLDNLDVSTLKDLPPLSEEAVQAYARNQESQFLSSMVLWANTLEAKNLTHLNSINIRRKLEKFPQIRLVKPCGALGADVLIVFFDHCDLESVKAHLRENSFVIQAHSFDLAGGFGTQIRNYGSEHVD